MVIKKALAAIPQQLSWGIPHLSLIFSLMTKQKETVKSFPSLMGSQGSVECH